MNSALVSAANAELADRTPVSETVESFQRIPLPSSSDSSFEFWFRGTLDSTPSGLTQWMQSISTLSQYSLFQGRLPSVTSILIDPNWKVTAGYWSPELRAPDGTPAILVSSQSISGNADQDLMLATHELTHLIHYQFRPQEESWVREGVALLAEYRITGHWDPSMIEALHSPRTSLVANLNLTERDHYRNRASLPQYGHLAQYFYYLYRLCGKDRLLTQLLTGHEESAGIAFLDETLRASGSPDAACQSFEASFLHFERARFMDSPYDPDDYVMHTTVPAALEQDANFVLPPYSAGAYKLTSQKESCAPNEYAWKTSRCIRIRSK